MLIESDARFIQTCNKPDNCLQQRNLAVQGCSNKEIGSFLGISYRTVEIHKSKIMQKTGATNLLDLARIARESDLGE